MKKLISIAILSALVAGCNQQANDNKQADKAAQVAAASVEMSLDDLMSEGEAVYNRQCLACHGAQGEGGVGNAIAGSAVALGDISKHLDVGIKGVAGTAMQAFEDTLTPSDIAAAVTYTRNAFGNETGDLVQPATIADATKG